MPRRYEWDARGWCPIINAEHLAMRDRVGMVDLSAFAVFDIAGTCALDYLQKLCVVQMNLPVGRVIYTSLLNTAGGIKADLTVMRLGLNHFRVVTGGADGMRDRKWFTDHLPEDGAVQLTDLTSSWAPIGGAGGRAIDPRGRRCEWGLPLRDLPLHRYRSSAGAGVADFLRRRAGLGALRAVRTGGAWVGCHLGSRPAASDRAGRHRRLRYDRTPGEVLSGLR